MAVSPSLATGRGRGLRIRIAPEAAVAAAFLAVRAAVWALGLLVALAVPADRALE
ncbi:MAG: hypothetical protein H0W90_13965, partial [Actinobacteria bacterium]|nr:hypothetical protein [Actinomycetota bacterium]